MTIDGWSLFGLSPLSWFSVAYIVVTIAALTSIWHSPLHGRSAKAVWTAMVTLLPFIGAVAWAALGRVPREKR